MYVVKLKSELKERLHTYTSVRTKQWNTEGI